MRAEAGSLTMDDRQQLGQWYANHAEDVIGLGQKIGSVWLPGGPTGDLLR